MKNLRVKSFVNEVFTTYSDYFGKVYSFSILLTSIVFIIVALLLRFSNLGPDVSEKWFTFYRTLFSRFSEKGIYSIVDFSKTIYLFFAGLLAISFFRWKQLPDNDKFGLSSFMKSLQIKDIFLLFFVLVVAGICDIVLYFMGYEISKTSSNSDNLLWLRNIFFELRIYFPIIIFSIAVSKRLLAGKFLFNWYGFITLIVSAWLFNEFAFEFSVLIKNYILTAITLNFEELNMKSVVESILSVPLFAIFLLGFGAVLYVPLSFFQKQNATAEVVN